MNVTSYVFGILAAVLTLVVVIEMLRRRRMRERHVVWWLVFGTLILILAIFPATLNGIADLLGITLPINLVFFVSIIVLFLVSLQQSVEATSLERKTRILAEEAAMLDERVRRLEAKQRGAQ